MNATDFKAMEGVRIGAVHGAVGALPAAALVFADTPAVVAPGAPLFTAAIILMVGAYMHWNHTDTGFWLISGIDEHCEKAEQNASVRRALTRSGTRHIAMNYLYGLGSVLCTVGGFAAVYSTFRSSISVDMGFVLAGATFFATSFELIMSRARQGVLFGRIQV